MRSGRTPVVHSIDDDGPIVPVRVSPVQSVRGDDPGTGGSRSVSARGRSEAQRPSNTGLRFSAKAATPSAKSCVRAQQAVGEALEVQADVALRARGRARAWPCRSASGAAAASSSASAAVARVELGARHDLGHEAPGQRLLRADAPAAQHHVLGARQADQPHEPLGAAGARDHPERDLGQRELHVVGRHAEVAGQRELQPDAEAVAVHAARSTGLRAALGRRDVPVQARELLRRRAA